MDSGIRARETLVRANMALVRFAVKKYARSTRVETEDLVQEGARGLLRAAEMFDGTRGYRFSTYAQRWIETAVQRACQNQGNLVRVPVCALCVPCGPAWCRSSATPVAKAPVAPVYGSGV